MKSPKESQQPADQEFSPPAFSLQASLGSHQDFPSSALVHRFQKCFVFLCCLSLPSPRCYEKIFKLQPQSNLKGIPAEFFPNSFKARPEKREESSSPTSTGIYFLTHITLFLPNFKTPLPTFFSASLPACSGNFQVQKCLDMLVKSATADSL